jgi:hypothetical protein
MPRTQGGSKTHKKKTKKMSNSRIFNYSIFQRTGPLVVVSDLAVNNFI